jgi:tetratricopeptide (TPR) repeat protein
MPKHLWDSLFLTTVGLVPFSLAPLAPAIATPPPFPTPEFATSSLVHDTAIGPSADALKVVDELNVADELPDELATQLTAERVITTAVSPIVTTGLHDQPVNSLLLVVSPSAPAPWASTPSAASWASIPPAPVPPALATESQKSDPLANLSPAEPTPAPASTVPKSPENQPPAVANPSTVPKSAENQPPAVANPDSRPQPPAPDAPAAEPKPTTAKPSPDPQAKPTDEPPIAPIKSAAEIERHKQLTEADRLYQAGEIAAAEKIYRLIKAPFAAAPEPSPQPAPITDAELLSPSGKVFWRESTIGLEQNMETRIFVPLQLLTERIPEFVPGHLRLAQVLTERGKSEQALAVLEKAAGRYPNQPELLKARITALGQNEKWMEATIAARQFALLNPESPLAAEFTTLAEENQKRYQRHMRRQLNSNLVGGIITGALSYALTGSLYGPLNAVQATALMLRGESAVGDRVTKQAKRHLKMVEDPEVVGYVNEIGQKLTKVTGRNDFKYEFFVVMDDALNAFALPGGKIFVNLGAIAKTNSEAELAGLLAHELSHTVLSHGFQLMTQGTLTANVTQFIPYVGGLAGELLVLNYSRDMERQADTMGTRILASAGYAADGLRNLMVTLQQQESKKGKMAPPEWASSHPAPPDRVRYLETLIITGGYNRYAFEGVERHAAMQAKVEKMLKDHKAEVEAKQKK